MYILLNYRCIAYCRRNKNIYILNEIYKLKIDKMCTLKDKRFHNRQIHEKTALTAVYCLKQITCRNIGLSDMDLYVGVCACALLDTVSNQQGRQCKSVVYLSVWSCGWADLGTVRRRLCHFISRHTCKTLHRKLPTGI